MLERILAAKRAELGALRATHWPSPPAARAFDLSRAPGAPLHVIAEIKRRSPSAGALSTRLSVGERAKAYERAGASMVSVLCDHLFFDGAFQHLGEARSACALPLLCKDFVIDEIQLDAARASGADAVLLIVRCLSAERVAALIAEARARALEPLVEIVDESEARIALDAGARLIGVNARDLDTLQMDPVRTARVLAALPSGIVAVHLSGVASPADVRSLADSRADAALVGEALMRRDDPGPLLAEMVGNSHGSAGGPRLGS